MHHGGLYKECALIVRHVFLFSVPDISCQPRPKFHTGTFYKKIFLIIVELLRVGRWNTLSAQDADGLLSAVLSSRAPTTVCKYGAAFGRWRVFAVERSMACLPTDRLQFTLYLERLARETSSVSVVEEVFNAVNWVHSIASLEPPASDGVVRSVMEGVRRMYASPVVKKEPVTIKDLRAIVESSNLSDLSDVRSTTMC